MFNQQILERFEALETPFYYYDLQLLRQTLTACKSAADACNFHVHYAMKANFDERVLGLIKESGIGADCVSGNEVKKAVEKGFDTNKIVFAGVGKSDKEINLALDLDIFAFNVESIQEIGIIDELCAAKGKTAKIAIRINPNVDAQTHYHITTGLEENKFGINQWELADCAEALKKARHIEFIGIHFHIGSQITDLNVFKSLCIKVNEMDQWFGERGFNLKVLNVGGGLGVDYHQPDTKSIVNFADYFAVFDQFLERRPGQEIHFELGRALVAPCGSLISRVLYVKNGLKKNFLILDAGMTELMRPMLYQAYHKIENISRGYEKYHVESIKDQDAELTDTGEVLVSRNPQSTSHISHLTSNISVVKYDVVGPICESTDCFGKEVELPESKRGDLVAIRTAGAYGEVMASGYNLRDRVRQFYSE